MDETHQLVAPADAGRIDRWLAAELPVSRSRLSALIEAGRVEVDGQTVRPSHKLSGGETVIVRVPGPPPVGLVAQDIPVPVLYQDEHIIVVDKPAGMVVHPAAGHWDGTLVNALLPSLAGVSDDDDGPSSARPGIVHRLDRGTSGVLVVARTPEAHQGLAEQFAAHTVDRRYVALVWGQPRVLSGTIDAPLARNPRDRLRFAVVENGRRAVTRWRVLGVAALPVSGDSSGGRVAMVECRLETGRTHQVRVHMTHVGHPLLGDPLYRRKAPVPDGLKPMLEALDHQLLHAWRLGFIHPITGQRLRFQTPPPADFLAFAAAVELSDKLPIHTD